MPRITQTGKNAFAATASNRFAETIKYSKLGWDVKLQKQSALISSIPHPIESVGGEFLLFQNHVSQEPAIFAVRIAHQYADSESSGR